jgi:cation-transporting ATPase 13A2
MENKLKPQTAGVIQQLKDADIRLIMATGDNLLTAVNIARQSKINAEDSECLLGEVTTSNGIDALEWKSTKDQSNHKVVSADFTNKSIDLALTGKVLQFLIM